jgi:hypothetical protein
MRRSAGFTTRRWRPEPIGAPPRRARSTGRPGVPPREPRQIGRHRVLAQRSSRRCVEEDGQLQHPRAHEHVGGARVVLTPGTPCSRARWCTPPSSGAHRDRRLLEPHRERLGLRLVMEREPPSTRSCALASDGRARSAASSPRARSRRGAPLERSRRRRPAAPSRRGRVVPTTPRAPPKLSRSVRPFERAPASRGSQPATRPSPARSKREPPVPRGPPDLARSVQEGALPKCSVKVPSGRQPTQQRVTRSPRRWQLLLSPIRRTSERPLTGPRAPARTMLPAGRS